MKRFKNFSTAVTLLFLNVAGFSQLKLGYSPASIQKSSILELESNNQGLLLPRITDTSLINVLSPSDGMVIYFTPARQLMIRSNGYWQALTFSGVLNNYWSTTGNTNGSSQVIGNVDNYNLRFITNNIERMRIANTGNIGIGTSSFDATNPEKLFIDAGSTTSFNLVNAKGNINNYLQLNIQNQSSGNTASSDIVATADNGTESVNYVDLGINSSGYSTAGILGGINNGYLYSTGNDFVIGNSTSAKNLLFFTGGLATSNERLRIDGNGNLGIGITNPTAILHLKAGSASANTAPLKFTSGSLMTTAEVGSVEFLTDKFYGTITTGTSRKEFTLNDAALTSGRIPVITTNGRLTSNANFVWDNANSRLGVRVASPTAYLHLGAGTASASTAPLKFTSGTNLTTPEAGAMEFNGTHLYFTIGSTRYQLDQQTGTTYTGSNGITLVGNDFRNNLITGLAGGQTVVGGTAAGNSLTLSSTSNVAKGSIIFGNSAYDELNNKLGIGNNAPTEALDVTGNLKFSGALMPNNNAGISGYILSSNGNGTAPTWINFGLSNLSDATITSPANGQLLQYTGTKWVNVTPSYLSSVDTSNISNFSAKVRSLFSGSTPITYSNGLIGITQATTSTNGYLSSADWNTFNNKLSSIDTTNISNFSAKVRSLFSGTAPITYSNGLIGISQATTSTNGYLSSADWNTFNNKLSSIDTTNISNFSIKVRSLFSGAAPITYSNGLIGIGQATTSTNGYLSSADWNTFNNKLSSVDTTSISSFSAKVRSLFSGTAPITYSNGLIGISQATTSTNGYLNSTDWNTFNNKLSTTRTITTTSPLQGGGDLSANRTLSITDAAADGTTKGAATFTASDFNAATGVISIDYTNGQSASGTTKGFLTSADWTTFNNKLSSVDTANISNFSVKVRSLFSGTAPIIYSNGSIGITQATTSTNGYLSSTDWNTFNNKAGNSNVWLLNGNSGITPVTNFIGTTDNKSLRFRSNNSERMIIDSLGRMGIGLNNPTNPLVVKDTMEIRRTGTTSELLFSNTAGSGDFRIGGDGGDIFWQGGGGRNLQMGSYWTTVLAGDRQNASFPSYINGTPNTGVLIPAQRDASVPLAIQSNSTTQTANLTEWRSSSGTVLDVVDKNGNMGVGSTAFDGSNPERLLVDAGNTSSFNVISGTGTINNYLQLNIQNNSPGAAASSDVVATSDNGTESVNYVDLGINSSGYSSSGVLGGANNAYLYSASNDFVIGNATASKNLRFFTGGTNTSNERMRIDGNGNVGVNTTSPNSTLDVAGSGGFAIATTSTSLTLDAANYTVIITGGTPSITLPAASGCARRIYIIVNQTFGSRTTSSYINFTGGTSTSVAANSSITIQSNGTSWYRIQ